MEQAMETARKRVLESYDEDGWPKIDQKWRRHLHHSSPQLSYETDGGGQSSPEDPNSQVEISALESFWLNAVFLKSMEFW